VIARPSAGVADQFAAKACRFPTETERHRLAPVSRASRADGANARDQGARAAGAPAAHFIAATKMLTRPQPCHCSRRGIPWCAPAVPSRAEAIAAFERSAPVWFKGARPISPTNRIGLVKLGPDAQEAGEVGRRWKHFRRPGARFDASSSRTGYRPPRNHDRRAS